VTLDDLGNLVDQRFLVNLGYLLDLEDPGIPENQWLPLYLGDPAYLENPVTLDDPEDPENRLYPAYLDFPALPFHLENLVSQ
jgi:hypothetical protein